MMDRMDAATAQSATGGAVATSHSLATEAGVRALRRGGNAIDAAIAAAAALCVVYPNNVALGGDLVALVRDPDGGTRFVNATGRAPLAAGIEELRARHGDALPGRGVDTITVPGGVRGWKTLAAMGARLSWPELLEDAQRLAADGHPTASSVARAIVAERAALDGDEGCRSVFLPGGEPLAEGDLLRQPALASTLGMLASGGPDAFYTGELGERWVAGLAAIGSMITTDDLAAAAPTVEEPITLEAFGVEVFTSPPNTQGFALLRTLRALEREGLADPLGRDAARLATLFAESNRVRAGWLADPDAGIGAAQLLGMPAPDADGDARVASGDTVGLVAVSDDGWAVSLVQSVYWPFGAAVLEPATGILFQNRGTAFSLDPTHPAALIGGRRPPHTLMPVLVDRGGRLAYAVATMGGQAQAQIHTHLLLRLLAGAAAAEATSAPRWIVGAQEEGDTARTLSIEAEVDAPTQKSLASAGLDVKILPELSELGHSNVIAITAAGYDAASDPRSDGAAIVVPGGADERARP